MKRLIMMIVFTLALAGCDHKQRETFTIATTDGRQILLTCPIVESNRSELTYTIDGHCVVEPPK